jgi:simple sugar transport system substrate-binding protein
MLPQEKFMSKFFAAFLALVFFASCDPRTSPGPASVAVFIPGTLQGSPTYELLDAGVRKAVAEVPGTAVKTIEGGFNQAQWGEQVATLAASGEYRYIVTSNPAMPEIAAKAAKAYPNQRFIILEAWSKNPSYATLAYDHRELAYLHGVLGGLIAADRKAPATLGLVVGQEYPDMNNAILPGFTEGLKTVSPDGRVEFRVIGNWYDAAKGAELTKALIDQGVSVVLPIAGGANQGVLTAAKAAKKAVLWYDVDGYAIEPGVIVGSGHVYQDKAAYELVKKALAGTLEYGRPRVVGVKEGYVDYGVENPAYRTLVPEAVRRKFESVLADFRSGKIHLPMPLPLN